MRRRLAAPLALALGGAFAAIGAPAAAEDFRVLQDLDLALDADQALARPGSPFSRIPSEAESLGSMYGCYALRFQSRELSGGLSASFSGVSPRSNRSIAIDSVR